MTNFLDYVLVLGLISTCSCKLSLQIVKNIEDFLTPANPTVEEKVGTTFSLICELISSDDGRDIFDDNLTWVKAPNISSIVDLEKFLSTVTNKGTVISQLNKSEKKFNPLKIEDKGRYLCVSRKYNLYTNISIKVRDNSKRNELRPMRETSFCTNQMFQCVNAPDVCIATHYVCDGVRDCKDGSDESAEKCNGDSCKDKIPCEGGRCIPSSWCCEQHLDPNCTVTNRPKCCQVLHESYEEYGYSNVIHAQRNGARYLFISVCIVSILFAIVLLLLIVSKVVIFAKKTALQQQRHNLCNNIALTNQTNVNVIRTDFGRPGNIYAYRPSSRTPRVNRNIIIDASDVNDPLLFSSGYNLTQLSAFTDQPPSYIDVLRNSRLISEPPPPYTSRELLNVNEERQERA